MTNKKHFITTFLLSNTPSINKILIKKLTSSISNIPCKCPGAFQVCSSGLNKFSFPVKKLAIKTDKTKEVIFCKVTQNMD